MPIEVIKTPTLWLVTGIEAMAGLVVAVAVCEAALRTVGLSLRRAFRARPDQPHDVTQIRLRLGGWLALGLEFELGADILRTAVAPTWSDIAQLAAIAAIRTGLNFFLQQETDKSAKLGADRLSKGAAT